MTKDDLKNSIAAECQNLDQRHMVANHDGNISVRISKEHFIVTPTGMAKRDIGPSDLLVVDINAKVIEGKHKVFSEWKWHRAIYELYPNVSCIVHAHPKNVLAMGLTEKELEYPGVPEALVSLGGPITTVKGLTPISSLDEIKSELKYVFKSSYATIVSGNGAFTIGNDPNSTSLRMELLEHITEAHIIAKQIGRLKALDRTLIAQLIDKRPPLTSAWSLENNAETESAISSPVQIKESNSELESKIKSLIKERLSNTNFRK